MRFRDILTEGFKYKKYMFPDVKGWKISLIDAADSDAASDTVRYTKKVGSKEIYVDFYDIDTTKEYSISSDGTFQGQDGSTKVTSSSSIRSRWKNIRDVPSIIKEVEQKYLTKV